jgi:hypothetical protein
MLPQLAEKLAALLVLNCCVAPSTTVGFRGVMEKVCVVGAPILSYPYTVYFGLVVAMPSIVQ